jgi:hypothetical protein
MGTFKIEITAVGGHGVDRSKKDGDVVNFSEGGKDTPDAITKKFVDELKAKGNNVSMATITHWPGGPNEVQDNFLTGIRAGKF